MVDRQATTATGTIPKEATVERFTEGLRGKMFCPGDNDYDTIRKIWNGMIDKRPAFIIRCAGVADVISAVNFARANNLLVAVRGGGHNVAGNAVCDGGIVIDLSPMKSVRVELTKRTVRAESGLTWGEFDHETQAFGLATTGGAVSTTGIAGLTLGGGLGWLMREYGLTCDNLLSIDIVTAAGNFLTASTTEHPDLFWGVRGGGGNFGVATSFEYKLHPVGQLLAGRLIHRMDKAKKILRFYRNFISSAPDKLSVMAGLLTLPHGVPVVGIILVYNGAIEKGEQTVRPLREFGPPLADYIGPKVYADVQTMFDATSPPGLRYYWKSNFMDNLSDDAIDTLVDRFAKSPSPKTKILIENLGGAVNRFDKDETVFDHRDAAYNLLITSAWTDPVDDEINIRWTRELWNTMQPFSSSGVYVNYLGQEADEGAERIKVAYGPAKYERLVALKNKYDPSNLFRLNQNIKPTV